TLTLTTAGFTARAISTQLGAGVVAIAGVPAPCSCHSRWPSRPKPVTGERPTSSSTNASAGHAKRATRGVTFMNGPPVARRWFGCADGTTIQRHDETPVNAG